MRYLLTLTVFVFGWSNFAFADFAPPEVFFECGIEFVRKGTDPQKVEVDASDIEGSDTIDFGSSEARRTFNGSSIYEYKTQRTVLFNSGAPSYSFELNYVLNANSMVFDESNGSGSFTDSKIEYKVFKVGSKKPVRQGVIGVDPTWFASDPQSGDLYWTSFNSRQNGSFETSSRLGVFNCEVHFHPPISIP